MNQNPRVQKRIDAEIKFLKEKYGFQFFEISNTSFLIVQPSINRRGKSNIVIVDLINYPFKKPIISLKGYALSMVQDWYPQMTIKEVIPELLKDIRDAENDINFQNGGEYYVKDHVYTLFNMNRINTCIVCNVQAKFMEGSNPDNLFCSKNCQSNYYN